MNLRGTELGIVEEKSSFGSAVVGISIDAGRLNSRTAHVSFSNVTDADLGASAASEDGVTEREVIFPLRRMSVKM